MDNYDFDTSINIGNSALKSGDPFEKGDVIEVSRCVHTCLCLYTK